MPDVKETISKLIDAEITGNADLAKQIAPDLIQSIILSQLGDTELSNGN